MTEVAAQTPGAARWSAEEVERIERVMGGIAAKQSAGEVLTPEEIAFSGALSAMLAAETDARDAFSAFYATLSPDQLRRGENEQMHLPVEVVVRVNHWVEQSRQWEAFVAALLAAPDTVSPCLRRRTGPRLAAALPALLRIPTAQPARDTLSALFAPHLWTASPDGSAIQARRNDTHVQIDCDDGTGFGPERAIQQIAKHGASAAQTFLTMAGLWLEHHRGRSHETYLSVYASDLLRFQRRKETPRGGYHREDLLAKGRDAYVLSRISLPRTEVVAYENGKRVVKTLSIGRLLSLESLDAEEETTENGDARSVLRFRYHLGKEVHDWLCGDQPQYAAISGKLLTYHPVRQKYQILLGFCLAYYDRVNRKNRAAVRTIGLPALLNLAGIETPTKRIAEFLVSIEDALRELARDGVIPELRLRKPEDWADLLAARKTRAIITRSSVVFPRLLSAPPGDRAGRPGALFDEGRGAR